MNKQWNHNWSYIWLMAIGIATVMLGCQSVRQEPSSDLVVVEHTDTV